MGDDNIDCDLGTRPGVLLFDLDETLCDYAAARRRRLESAFRIALRDVPAPQWPDLAPLIDRSIAIAPHGDAHFPDLLRAAGCDDPAAIDEARTWFRRHRLHSLALFPDAKPMFAALRATDRGARFGIITNGPADIQREKVAMLGLLPLVETVVISGEVGVAKPAPGIFMLALDRLCAPAADAIYLGDAPAIDIAGAHAAGIPAVWMNRTGVAWPRTLPRPVAEVTSLAAFARLIAALPDRT
jgi:putative hydrolase of the HAD superfamily